MRAANVRRALVAAAIGTALVVAPACSDDDDPPPATGTTPTAPATTDGATATAPSGELTVYFADAEGHLVAETREGPADLLGAMGALAAGPIDTDLIPALPAGTTVLGAELDGTLARVDLSAEFESGYPSGGAAAELATVGPIVHTAAEVAGVESVEITVEGRVPEPTGTQLDFSTPLTPEDVPLDHPAP